jgi:hypothetical protein
LPVGENAIPRVSFEKLFVFELLPTPFRKNQPPWSRNGDAPLTGRPTVNVWILSSLRLPT